MGGFLFKAVGLPGTPGVALHGGGFHVLGDQLGPEEFLGSERLMDFLENRQTQDGEAVYLAAQRARMNEQTADALDVFLWLSCRGLREASSDVGEIGAKIFVVGIVERICGPVAKSLARGGSNHLCESMDNASPELGICRIPLKVSLALLGGYTAKPATHGATIA